MAQAVLGVIPARGGSVGIPRKALVPLRQRPLLAYTADAARESSRLTRTIVSTDDAEIADVARTLGLDVPFMRPAALAAAETPMLPVLQHALTAVRATGTAFDIVVLLQPTSPLRTGRHIDEAVALLEASAADAVVTVVAVPHQFNPVSVMRLEGDRLQPFLGSGGGTAPLRRQDKPAVLARNGPAVLAVRSAVLDAGSLYGADCRPLLMADEDSIDVDTPWDLALAEFVLARRAGAWT
jgi:CMP-N-acetylneuraminic acid synthetase